MDIPSHLPNLNLLSQALVVQSVMHSCPHGIPADAQRPWKGARWRGGHVPQKAFRHPEEVDGLVIIITAAAVNVLVW